MPKWLVHCDWCIQTGGHSDFIPDGVFIIPLWNMVNPQTAKRYWPDLGSNSAYDIGPISCYMSNRDRPHRPISMFIFLKDIQNYIYTAKPLLHNDMAYILDRYRSIVGNFDAYDHYSQHWTNMAISIGMT